MRIPAWNTVWCRDSFNELSKKEKEHRLLVIVKQASIYPIAVNRAMQTNSVRGRRRGGKKGRKKVCSNDLETVIECSSPGRGGWQLTLNLPGAVHRVVCSWSPAINRSTPEVHATRRRKLNEKSMAACKQASRAIEAVSWPCETWRNATITSHDRERASLTMNHADHRRSSLRSFHFVRIADAEEHLQHGGYIRGTKDSLLSGITSRKSRTRKTHGEKGKFRRSYFRDFRGLNHTVGGLVKRPRWKETR